MMRITVKNREGKTLGVLAFTPDNQSQFIGDYDSNFGIFVDETMKNGISQNRDIYNEKEDKFILVNGPIDPSDKNFPLAFKEYLERNGYDVTEMHPEIEEEIKSLLEVVKGEDDEKKELLDRLPNMSYAEQTYVLGELRAILEDKSG